MLPRFTSLPGFAIHDTHIVHNGERIPLDLVASAEDERGLMGRKLRIHSVQGGSIAVSGLEDPDLAAQIINGLKTGRLDDVPVYGHLEIVYLYPNRLELIVRGALGGVTRRHVFLKDVKDASYSSTAIDDALGNQRSIWAKPRLQIQLRNGDVIPLDVGRDTEALHRMLLGLL